MSSSLDPSEIAAHAQLCSALPAGERRLDEESLGAARVAPHNSSVPLKVHSSTMLKDYDKMNVLRRALLAGAATLSATWAVGQPVRPIRVVVPGPAGSAMDALARAISNPFGRVVGRTVVVENLPGAGGTLATAQVARAAADGYTIEIVSSNHVINPSVFRRLPYDTIADFSPIALIGVIPMVLVISPSLKVNSVRELVALAKSRPGNLNYGSLGVGTVLHLAGELFAHEAGIEMTHVPYKDAAGVTTDLASGQIEMAFLGLPTVAGLVKADRIKALAVTTARRSSAMPEIPSISETLPKYAMDAWIGLIGPKGLPAETRNQYFQAVKVAMDDPRTKEAMATQALTPTLMGPDQAQSFFVQDLRRSADLVKRSGASPQ
jgi:tripartite-type tricarboxylate transporter receptor subunit TctC